MSVEKITIGAPPFHQQSCNIYKDKRNIKRIPVRDVTAMLSLQPHQIEKAMHNHIDIISDAPLIDNEHLLRYIKLSSLPTCMRLANWSEEDLNKGMAFFNSNGEKQRKRKAVDSKEEEEEEEESCGGGAVNDMRQALLDAQSKLITRELVNAIRAEIQAEYENKLKARETILDEREKQLNAREAAQTATQDIIANARHHAQNILSQFNDSKK